MYGIDMQLGCARDMTDEAFFAAFESATLPAELFRHPDHVRMAWLYLKRMPLIEALPEFGESLRRLATALGQPNLYHETVTWGFLILVNERMRSGRDGDSWAEFAERNEDLLRWKDGPFFDCYDPDILDNVYARRFFVLPTASAATIAKGDS